MTVNWSRISDVVTCLAAPVSAVFASVDPSVESLAFAVFAISTLVARLMEDRHGAIDSDVFECKDSQYDIHHNAEVVFLEDCFVVRTHKQKSGTQFLVMKAGTGTVVAHGPSYRRALTNAVDTFAKK